MKKITLLFSLLFALNLQAQSLLSYSFESGEGFTLGEINNQNGWASNPNYSQFVNVVDSQSTDGSFSLQFQPDPNGPIPGNSITGTGISSLNFLDVTFTADLFVESGLNPSEFNIILQSPSANALTSRVVFFDGTIILVDSNPNPQFVNAGTYTSDTWFELKIVHDFTGGTIEYFIDDNLFYSGNVVNGTNIEEMLLFSSFNQTGFFIDNIRFSNNVLNTEEFTDLNLSVYPNPTTERLFIENADHLEIKFLTCFDVTGKQHDLLMSADQSINVSNLNAGLYILNLQTDLGNQSLKFIKK
jgi:hypothetical protein